MKWLVLISLFLPNFCLADACFIDVKVLDSASGIKRAAVNASTIKFFYPLQIKLVKNDKTFFKEITVIAFGNDVKDQNKIDARFDQIKDLINNCQIDRQQLKLVRKRH